MIAIGILIIAVPVLYGAWWAYHVGNAWCLDDLPGSSLGRWNYCLFQFLWFRVTRELDDNRKEFPHSSPAAFMVGKIVNVEGQRYLIVQATASTFEAIRQIGWGIIVVAPMTGWGSDYWPRGYSGFRLFKIKPNAK